MARLLLALCAIRALAQQCDPLSVCCLTTLSGNASNVAGFADGPASTALLNLPFDLKYDDTFTLIFIADDANNRIRLYNTTSQMVSTLAGNGTAGLGTPATCFPDAVGTNAVLGGPKSTDWDPFTQQLYIADSGNNAIRALSMATRAVATIAGSDKSTACAAGLVNAVGTNARFNSPRGVAFDVCSRSYVYTAEFNTHVVRRLELATGLVTLLAGSALGASGSATGVGTNARFNQPKGIGLDLSCSNLYVLDSASNRAVVVAVATAAVSIVAGGPTASGTADGVGTNAKLNNPSGLQVDQSRDRIIIGDYGNNRVRQIAMSSLAVSTLVGSSPAGWADGNTSVAKLNQPKGVIVRATDGAILISDSSNHVLRALTCPFGPSASGTPSNSATPSNTPSNSATPSNTPSISATPSNTPTLSATMSGTPTASITPSPSPTPTAAPCSPSLVCCVTTLVGGPAAGAVDGSFSQARLSAPFDMKWGNEESTLIFVVDDANNQVRGVNLSAGLVFSVAGNVTAGYADGVGTGASFNAPKGLVVDLSRRTIFVGDSSNHAIRAIDMDTLAVSTLAGAPPPVATLGMANAVGSNARFNSPRGLAIDCSRSFLYVADNSNYRVRMVALATGVVTTAIGSGVQTTVLGFGTAAALMQPRTLGFDSNCATLFIADGTANKIRAYDTASTFCGVLVGGGTMPGATPAGFLDGPNSTCKLNNPSGLVADAPRNRLLIGDVGNNALRVLDLATLNMTTLAARTDGVAAPAAGFVDGPARGGGSWGAMLSGPKSALVSPDGAIFFSDSANNAIRVVTCPAGTAPSASPSPSNPPTPSGTRSGTASPTPSATSSATPTLSATGSGTPSRTLSPTASVGQTPTASPSPSPGGCVVRTLAGTQGYPSEGVGRFVSANGVFGVALSANASTLYFITNLAPFQVRAMDTTTFAVRTLFGGAAASCLSASGAAGCDGAGTAALLNAPSFVAFDPGLNALLTAEQGGGRIRLLNLSSGNATTLGGNGTEAYTDGPLGLSQFSDPRAAVYHPPTNAAYVSDTGSFTIRAISLATRVASTLAGLGGSAGAVDGVGTAARFMNTRDIALDSSGGGLYVADNTGCAIRWVHIATRNVSTVVGALQSTACPTRADGPPGVAKLVSPLGLAPDFGSARLFFTDDSMVRYASLATWVVTTLANTANAYNSHDGYAQLATFKLPKGIAAAWGGAVVYVGDFDANSVRAIYCGAPAINAACSAVSTVAGVGVGSGVDGPLGVGSVLPFGVVGLAAGTALYVADATSIRVVDLTSPTLNMSTLAGNGSTCAGGNPGFWGCDSAAAASVTFKTPSHLSIDEARGALYVADQGTHVIRRVALSDGATVTVAGRGTLGIVDGPPGVGALNAPIATVPGPSDALFIADSGNDRLRLLNLTTGALTFFCGVAQGMAEGNCSGAAKFANPKGLAFDAGSRRLYVADYDNARIRRVLVRANATAAVSGAESAVTTFVGSATVG